MIRKIIETKKFSKSLDDLLKKRSLLKRDFDVLKKELAINPEAGVPIVGTGGVRKIRLKSASGGKSGGFRICYYYFVQDEAIYLLLIYGKNEQESLTMVEKNALRILVSFLKGEDK